MEIRCSECSHLGDAAEVRPVDDGVGLVCAECAHVNVVTAAGSSVDDRGRDGDLPDDEPIDDGDASAQTEKNSSFVEESFHRLIPESGDGTRCRKCANLVGDDDKHCPRCGLDLEMATDFEPGEAPWEEPPPGKDDEYRQALSLWDDILEEQRPEAIHAFVDFVIDEDLVDLGIRKIQHYLVEHRDDQDARDGLKRLAKRLEVTINMARTHAEAKSSEFGEEIKQFRSRLLIGALVFWTVILLLFSWLFWDVI